MKPEKRQGDVVAGDTLARGHVDKGETRVSGMEYRFEKDPRSRGPEGWRRLW